MIKKTYKSIYTSEQIKRVLVGSGIEITNEIESDFIMFCPFHNNSRTPAGEVDKITGTFFCFACQHVTGLIELIMNTTSRSYFEAARFIKDKEVQSDLSYDIEKQLQDKVMYSPYDELVIKRLNNQALESQRAMTYYSRRLITHDSVKKFSLGYSDKQDMVTIPVASPDGTSVGFVGRSVEGKEFKNTPGLPKSKLLFNLHRVKTSDKVYIVESSFDAIRLDQVGMPAVATLGSNVSAIQIDLLKKYFNDIILIADNDDAGNTMRQKLIDKLGSRISVIKLEGDYKDIGDMDDESIKKLEYRFDNSIMSMLQ
jgi:DNA primase